MFVFDDGGRVAAGFKGKTGDCGVRAMAIALELPYADVYRELAQANKDSGRKKSVRRGMMKEVYSKVLSKHGWEWCSAPKFDGRKARYSDLPNGRCIVSMAKHFAAVIDGELHDSWDSRSKMVYGYWIKTHEGIDPEEERKHARLMAAAPDLLDALEEVTGLIEEYCEDHNSDRPTDVTVVLPRLKAAIAKAKGGE